MEGKIVCCVRHSTAIHGRGSQPAVTKYMQMHTYISIYVHTCIDTYINTFVHAFVIYYSINCGRMGTKQQTIVISGLYEAHTKKHVRAVSIQEYKTINSSKKYLIEMRQRRFKKERAVLFCLNKSIIN